MHESIDLNVLWSLVVTIELLLDVFGMSDDPMRSLGLGDRNINQLEHTLAITVETTKANHQSITFLHFSYHWQRSS